MNIKDLTLEEEALIIKHRLDKLAIKQIHGPVVLTGSVTGENSNLVITLHNSFNDSSEAVILDDEHCKELYDLISNRYKTKNRLLTIKEDMGQDLNV